MLRTEKKHFELFASVSCGRIVGMAWNNTSLYQDTPGTTASGLVSRGMKI